MLRLKHTTGNAPLISAVPTLVRIPYLHPERPPSCLARKAASRNLEEGLQHGLVERLPKPARAAGQRARGTTVDNVRNQHGLVDEYGPGLAACKAVIAHGKTSLAGAIDGPHPRGAPPPPLT